MLENNVSALLELSSNLDVPPRMGGKGMGGCGVELRASAVATRWATQLWTSVD